MTRLVHSWDGVLRSMQISSTQLFCYVEGCHEDPYFYGRLSGSVCSDRDVKHEVRLSRELGDGGSGGGENETAEVL